MSTALRERPTSAGTSNGGVPARRAVIRWSWRMFRREWRQQTLVLALIVVALAATVVGAAVATNTPPPSGAGFGTAQDMATLPGGPHLAGQIAVLQQHGPLHRPGAEALLHLVVDDSFHHGLPGPFHGASTRIVPPGKRRPPRGGSGAECQWRLLE